MNKIEFLTALEERLSVLPESDKQRSLHYFEELIEDRVEEGLTEDEAVADLETVDEIADRILNDTTEVAETGATSAKGKRFHNCPLWLVILLAVIGSPIWVPIVFAIGITALSIYIIPWCIILCFYATAIGLFFGGLGGFVISFFVGSTSGPFAAALCFGGSLFCVGAGILLIFPSVIFTKWMAKATAWCYRKLVALGKGAKKK